MTEAPEGIIYVILPVHDRRPLTEAFVRSLLAQTDRQFRLILIDDGSSDDSAAAVTDLLPDAVVIRGSGSWWWGGSLQQGHDWLRRLEPAPDDIVLIANDDTQIPPDFLATGRRALARHPRSLLLPRLYRRDGSLHEVGAHVDWRRLRFRGVSDPDAVNVFSTRGLFVRALDFLAIGGFHPRLLPHYLSDYEFTIRARRRGYRLVSDPELSLVYDERTTGIRAASTASPWQYIRQTLSIKSAKNPVYLTTFVLLACPRRHAPRNVLRIWAAFGRGLLAAARPARRARTTISD